MLKLENVTPQEMPEVVRIASELYQQDQQKEGEAQERQATLDAAEEVGLPAEYLHRAAEEMHARRVVEVQERRRKRTNLMAVTGIVASLGVTVWLFSLLMAPPAIAPPMTAPPAITVPVTPQQWNLQANPQTQATIRIQDNAMTIQVEKFVPQPNGSYFANADTYQVPPSLEGYQNVRFRVRGTGLSQTRLYLENGPTERWRSRAIPITPNGQEVTLRLQEFEHLTRPFANTQFKRQEYTQPGRIERLSFKTGDFVNDVGAKGEVTIDNVKFE
jgi:hypothetical protein